MTAALVLAALLAGGESADWFRIYQYSDKAANLRGCSECQGEPDDLCELPPGVQSRDLDEYARQPSAGPGRIRLLRSRADPDCAARAAALFAPKTDVQVAAVRLAAAPPSAALIDRFATGFTVPGWPRASQRRKGVQPAAAAPDRGNLRAALVCWGSVHAWPMAPLGPKTTCEWWLLPVRVDGQPDLAGRSFPLLARHDRWPEPFPFGDSRWGAAFDRAHPFDDSVLLGDPPTQNPGTPSAAAELRIVSPNLPAASPAPAAVARCGPEARQRSALLDRFDQWEGRITGARRSLDRNGFTIDAAAWSGHCPEMEVLRSALEQQLGCAVAQEGRCVGPSGEGSR